MSRLGDRFHRWQHRWAPYLFVAPFLVVFLCFGLYPLVRSVILAFHITAGPEARVFAGLENFRFMLTDPDFYQAVGNTATFAFFSVALQLPLALFLAVLLDTGWLRLRNVFRLSFFAPRLVGVVFVGVLFGLVFAPRFGLLNVALHEIFGDAEVFGTQLGRLDRGWLKESDLIMPALVLTALWMYTGLNMIYFLAALQNVDRTLYEAARIDGAGAWQRFRHVTWPGIKPVAVFVVILSVIGSFQLFELPYILLNQTAGAGQAGLTVVMYLYQNGFVTGDLGYASAVGWTLALAVLVVTMIQLILSGTLKKAAAH